MNSPNYDSSNVLVSDKRFTRMVLMVVAVGALVAMIGCATAEPTPAITPTLAPVIPTNAPAATPTPNANQGVFRLTVLHNNDGESQLLNLGPDLKSFGGVERFATALERERNAALAEIDSGVDGAVITVSSGDNFLASAEFTAGQRDGVYYDAEALDRIGYDAIALGNHDFDFGPEVLAEFIKSVSRSRTPFLSSNLDFSAEPELRDLFDSGRISGSRVLEGGDVGIIGATTPNLSSISSPRKVKVIQDVVREVQLEVDRLESEGVEIIVLISHMEDLPADMELLSRLTGVDVLVAGGSKEVLANPCDLLIPGDDPYGAYPIMSNDRTGESVPVVSTSGRYAYLGKLVVDFNTAGEIVNVDDLGSRPIRIAANDNPHLVQEDYDRCRRSLAVEKSQLAEDVHSQVVSSLENSLDQLTQPIAELEVSLDGRKSQIRSGETNQGNLMADALLWQATRLALDYGAILPDVAIQNSGGIRNDSVLDTGQIREIDTFDMAPFSNLVTVVEGISREQFKEVLENAVSRAVDGDGESGTGRFAQVAGFRFEWSESGVAQVLNSDGSVNTPGTRIQRVVLDSGAVVVGNGKVIPGDPLAIATVDFLARGGDEYPYRGATFTTLGVTYQQALTNFIKFPEGLDGDVTATKYPESGQGRIIRLP